MTTSTLPEYDFPNSEKPSEGCPMVLEGKAHPVESAELSLRLITETWDGESSVYLRDPVLMMVIDVYVDESSGEDGEPAPIITFTFDKPLPSPEIFLRSEWSDADTKCDASYGNEAPNLVSNHVALSGLRDGLIGVRWTARYEQDGRLLPFLYEGKVAFKGLIGTVKKPADFHATLSTTAPGWAGLRCTIEKKVDFDPSPTEQPWVNCTILLD